MATATATAVFTYQTRLAVSSEQEHTLSALAELFSRIERHLFVALQAGQSRNELKQTYQPRFGITARHYNSLYQSVTGKINSLKELQPHHISELTSKIASARKRIAALSKKGNQQATIHQKQRRLKHMERRLQQLKADQSEGKLRLCFGSRRLFNQQFHLQENHFADHEQWLAAWRQARHNQFVMIGSKDETAGNQSCQLLANADGSFALQLRLPDALRQGGDKYFVLPLVTFKYGQPEILAALASSQLVSSVNAQGTISKKRTGTALSYRFLKDQTSWRLFVSITQSAPEQTTQRLAGAIGIDVNADHLALAETDRFGNLLDAARLPLVTYGKSTHQAQALIGDVAKHIALRAQAAGKPVVIEKLDFKRKKSELEDDDAKRARCLSCFAYSKILSSIKSACFRAGVEVIEVNPAYTSVIGAINYAQKKGISVHMAAAFAIARRGMRLSELPPLRQVLVPTRNGDHVTFVLPVRDKAKHVWSHWSKLKTALNTAHVAHFRRGDQLMAPPPLRSHPSLSAVWKSQVNRTQICQECVLDIPF